jgi:hypothetical protein
LPLAVSKDVQSGVTPGLPEGDETLQAVLRNFNNTAAINSIEPFL